LDVEAPLRAAKAVHSLLSNKAHRTPIFNRLLMPEI
jgi:hypothetical protein